MGFSVMLRGAKKLPAEYWCPYGTVKAPEFGTLNSAISNFQTWFVRTVMEVLKYYWM